MSHNGIDRQEVKPPAEQKGRQDTNLLIDIGSA